MKRKRISPFYLPPSICNKCKLEFNNIYHRQDYSNDAFYIEKWFNHKTWICLEPYLIQDELISNLKLWKMDIYFEFK
jgi:hypothetical protein